MPTPPSSRPWSKGALLKQEAYGHRYPYDWRTKAHDLPGHRTVVRLGGWPANKPRCHRCRGVDPGLGRNRIEAMVKERGDWCISRQRTWGVPIPVFNRSNGEVLLNADTLANIEALIAEHGADIWWEKDEAELLPPPMRPGRSMAQGHRHHGCVLTRAPAGPPSPASASSSAIPQTCISRDPTSTVAGSRAPCSPLWR